MTYKYSVWGWIWRIIAVSLIIAGALKFIFDGVGL